MGIFERYLTLWVALCIVAGIALGQAVPAVFQWIGDATVAQVNLPVAILVWLMIVPMLLKIDPRALGEVGQHWRGIAATVGVNWLIKPFSMALLGWLFIGHLFRPLLPEGADRRLHRRTDPAGRRTLHGHGVRVVEPGRRRAALHPEPGRAERHDHGGGVRTHRRAAARAVLDQRPLGHAAAVGAALHRGAGDRRPAVAPGVSHRRRPGGAAAHAAASRTAVAGGPAADPDPAVRTAGRADRPATSGHPAAGDPDPACRSISTPGSPTGSTAGSAWNGASPGPRR